MYSISTGHIIGIVATLIVITAVGIYSGRKVKSEQDFSIGGRRANSPIVAGTIMGTLVGGASTIGTAQLAYLYGFSAWWFTLGAGLGCLILGLSFAGPLYDTKKDTVPQMLEEKFGPAARSVSSIFSSIGIALNIVAQVLAAIALLTSMFNISSFTAAIITIALMAAYVVFGGVWGTGLVGIAKLLLLYVAAIASGAIALINDGGIGNFQTALAGQPYFSLFGRGVWIDGAAGLSLLVGVLSTQTYIQAILSGRNVKESKKGALISAALIPPIGIAGIFVGIYMRVNFPKMDPGSVFPVFIINNLNPLFAGVALSTLLIAVVGTGAGLALGVSTILTRDIYKVYIRKNADNAELLKVTRIIIVGILMITLLFISGNLKSLILQWSFMSMGLRGATVFAPLCAVLFMKKEIDSKMIVCSMIAGPVFTFAGKLFLPASFDPLFLGIAVSIGFVAIGYARGSVRKADDSTAN